jgi:hypothetical protein
LELNNAAAALRNVRLEGNYVEVEKRIRRVHGVLVDKNHSL